MPPQFPSSHRGMTANPARPVKRYRPGKALVEEQSSSEDEEQEEEEEELQQDRKKAQEEEERRIRLRQQQQQRQRAAAAPAPKATSFPTGAGRITKGVKDVRIEEEEEEEEDDDDEEGFVTEEEGDEEGRNNQEAASSRKVTATQLESPVTGPTQAAVAPKPPAAPATQDAESEEEEEESEDESEEESSSEEEAPKRVLLRPTFIKKDRRKETADKAANGNGAIETDANAESEEILARRRQEKADQLVREQLEKEAMARMAGRKAWDDEEEVGEDEDAIDDRDGLDPEAEYAAWKLRELKRVKREREAIEAAEKEREEIERRRNLTTEEREKEDREFIAKQKEEKESRGQTGYMQRYFHKGAFFRDELEREGIDKRDIMGGRFADETNREVLPQYMQIRDMTKLGKKGRTKYRDLRSEDTGRWAEGFENRPRKNRDDTLLGVTDDRFLPDRPGDRKDGPTGANASVINKRRRSRSRSPQSRQRERRLSRSRSYSPRRKGRFDDDRNRQRGDNYNGRSGDRYKDHDTYRGDDGKQRKRSPSPYEERDKRRRISVSPM